MKIDRCKSLKKKKKERKEKRECSLFFPISKILLFLNLIVDHLLLQIFGIMYRIIMFIYFNSMCPRVFH